jgi:hypothetical protein
VKFCWWETSHSGRRLFIALWPFSPIIIRINGSVLNLSAIDSSDAEAMQEGLFGKSMFQKRWHGDCTSTAILQSTILKALGIPTRLVVSIPIVDFNDPKELDLVRGQIKNADAKQAILAFSEHAKGSWGSHTFNEVYIGRQWVCLNYNRIGQGLIDKDFLGVMVQVERAADWSQMGLATWALHVFGKTSTKLASINPYRTLSLSDNL